MTQLLNPGEIDELKFFNLWSYYKNNSGFLLQMAAGWIGDYTYKTPGDIAGEIKTMFASFDEPILNELRKRPSLGSDQYPRFCGIIARLLVDDYFTTP